jgi:tripartite-type tricarboxylate transporter receptor subunit TctC
MDARSMPPNELSKRIKSDVAKWSEVIEKTGVEKH